MPARIVALEIMVATPAVSNLIRENKTHQLTNVLQTSRRLGMQTLDDAIEGLVKKRMIAPEEAFEKAINKERFLGYLKRVPEEYIELIEKQDPALTPPPIAKVERGNVARTR